MYQITIPGNTPAKKNSKSIFCPKNCPGNRYSKKKPNLVLSKTHREWYPTALQKIKFATRHVTEIGKEFRYPVTILFVFYRKDRRRFDYSNLIESIQDLIVSAGLLPDDDRDHLKPIIVGHAIDRRNPRAEIYIFNHGENWIKTHNELYLKILNWRPPCS